MPKKPRGRPKKDYNSKRNHVRETKLTNDELSQLNYICSRYGKTASEILRDGIRIQFEKAIKE